MRLTRISQDAPFLETTTADQWALFLSFYFFAFPFSEKKGNGLGLFAKLSLTFSRAVFHDIGDSEQGLIKFQNAIKAR